MKLVAQYERALNDATKSVYDFHKQQRQLYKQFQMLRQKHEALVKSSKAIVWQYLPAELEKFSSIPPMDPAVDNFAALFDPRLRGLPPTLDVAYVSSDNVAIARDVRGDGHLGEV